MIATDPSEKDAAFMRQALRLGRNAQGQSWPNPSVGCLIVKENIILGQGWTASGGRPHAEQRALKKAGREAKGATAYVSLEPCSHHGKTPPCAQALIDAGIHRVVMAISDPDRRVAGRGIAMLKKAGIATTIGIGAEEATIDHAGFFMRITKGKPMVTLKLALSLDGRIATASGESQWITGEKARNFGQHLRATHDAVMVGGQTARADDPRLTLRGYPNKRPTIRIVLSKNLSLPNNGPLASSMKEAPLWLIHGAAAPEDRRDYWRSIGAKLIEAPLDHNQQIELNTALALLGAEGLTRIYCEGGGQLAASLLSGRHVQQIYAMHAGLMLGADAHPAMGNLAISHLSEASRWHLLSHHPCGPDIISRWWFDQ